MTNPDQGDPGTSSFPMPSSQPMLLRGVKWGVIATVASMAVFSGIGFFVGQVPGLLGGLIGAGVGGAVLLVTVGSIAFGNRFATSPIYPQIFFSIVLGAWALKLIAFIIAVVLLKDQPWLDNTILFIALVATILVSIVIDAIIVSRARLPLSVDLP